MRGFKMLLPVVLSIFMLTACSNMVQRGMKKRFAKNQETARQLLTGDTLQVYLVGSGGPISNSERISSSTAVFAGGQFILVDVGPGASRSASIIGLPLARLSAVLLTHFHSDHIGDLGETNFNSWAGGRQKALKVFGPQGVEKIVKGFGLAYDLDGGYRTAHHGKEIMNPAFGGMVPQTVTFPNPDDRVLVFENNGLKVYAFLVDHAPVIPAVGYRFEYKGNVVVTSGDTRETKNLVKHAQGADILISNGLSFQLTDMMHAVAVEVNNQRMAKILKDIQDYQLDPVQAAKIAKEAGVKKLVFNHIVPPLQNFYFKRKFLEGVDDVYDGEVVLGTDGMKFELDPKL